MTGIRSMRALAAAAALVCLSTAHAGSSAAAANGNLVATFIDVNLAGLTSAGDFGDPANTSLFRSIGIGATVTGWDYINLSFATVGASWLSEFVLSVNNSDASGYFDATLSDIDDSGSFGPASGTWGSSTPLYDGDAFSVTDGNLWITAYELYDDDGVDAVVSSGTLRVYFTSPVPEPATYGLMALGLLAVGAAARRRSC